MKVKACIISVKINLLNEIPQIRENLNHFYFLFVLIGESLPLIRPLGSAPDLPVKNWNNLPVGPGIIRMPIRPALRQTPQQSFAATSYGMMRMPQPHVAQSQQKRKKSFKSSLNTSTSLSGGSGGGSNKRVMFSGVSDNESASESQDDSTQNAHSNTLPILKVIYVHIILY